MCAVHAFNGKTNTTFGLKLRACAACALLGAARRSGGVFNVLGAFALRMFSVMSLFFSERAPVYALDSGIPLSNPY